ncbi:phage major capsid protein [Cellulosilyticum sp. ST5]|uniref:phage major capsid protein n=1 Tax=Cellulosilyticum sp. ST5 TaxID=3055805 RepID=UPI003977C8DD
MKKSVEMKKELEALKNSIKSLQAENKIEEAHNKLEELTRMKNAIEVQEAIEEEETTQFNGAPLNKQSDKVDLTVVFNKLVLGKPLTEAENALASTGQIEASGEQGGYLVPEEQKTQIVEFMRQLVSLKQYCNIIPVGTLAGSMPLEVEASDQLINFDELSEIAQSDVRFGQTTWKLADYGDIIPISNTLLADEKANLTGFIGRRFAKKAVRTENTKILSLLDAATAKVGADYKAINTILNKELDPAISATSIIITNQDGFDYLDGLTDTNNRPLLTTSLADATQKMYKGRPIVVLPNNQLASTGANKYTFIIGNISEFIAFFDRGAYEMAVSKEAGFTKNATLMRVVERFDAKAVDTKAAVKLTITVA